MTIGIWQIVLIIVFIAVWIGFGYVGIYLCNKYNFLKKYIKKNNVLIICLIYLVITSFVTGKNIPYVFGTLITLSIFTSINSFFRNKFKFKEMFDQKFFQFLFGLIFVSAIVNLLNLFPW